MVRFDYTESSIKNLINANIKLVDENKDLKLEVEEKRNYIKNIKFIFKSKLIDGVEEIKIKDVIDILNNEYEEDLFDCLLQG